LFALLPLKSVTNYGVAWMGLNYLKALISNKFSVIFPSFVNLLATKPMAKQSRASGQLSGGHWVEYRAEF
jgi:hypothetical protein